MNAHEAMNTHEVCIEILEGICHFETMIENTKYSLRGIAGQFPDLVKEYTHKIEIYEMCIKRLKQRHQKQLNKLQIPECFQD